MVHKILGMAVGLGLVGPCWGGSVVRDFGWTALLRDGPAARGRDVRHLLGGVGLESSTSPQCASFAAMVGASMSPRAA